VARECARRPAGWGERALQVHARQSAESGLGKRGERAGACT
jgi:hypothetical protein